MDNRRYEPSGARTAVHECFGGHRTEEWWSWLSVEVHSKLAWRRRKSHDELSAKPAWGTMCMAMKRGNCNDGLLA